MVAGEASGDLLGGHLIAALKAKRPGLQFSGIGGPKMQEQGFETYFPMEKLSVRGYVEVLRHYREIMRIRRRLAPKKGGAEAWLNVHREAHELGFRTTATMMYGHVESDEDIIRHLEAIRDLQDLHHGFTALYLRGFVRQYIGGARE